MKLKLFVWEDVLTDYTSGMVCILAESEEYAFELLYKKNSVAWAQLQGIWEVLDWTSPEIKKLQLENPNSNLTELQHLYMERENIKLGSNRIHPKIITNPEAFVVEGGG